MTERTRAELLSQLSHGGSADDSVETRFVKDLLDSILVTEDNILTDQGITATADEINKAADVSSYVVELTASGAIPAAARQVELNHESVVIAATYTVIPNTTLIIKDTSASGTAAHTVTLTDGTFNGTATVATLNARDEFLMVHFDSAGRGQVIANVGAVALS